jgi:hypothetical protein
MPMLLFLCGCSVGGGVHTEKSVKEYETDFSYAHAEVIKISGLTDSDFQDSLNSELSQSVESDLVAFDSEASASEDNVRLGNKCILEITWDEKYNKNNFLSIMEEKYVYTGGAHGSSERYAKNIDTAAGKELTLSDLFADDGYISTLNRMIAEEAEENPDEYKNLWAKPEINDNHQTDFYISDNHLVIFFRPYDLSYYAKGFIEFELDFDDLSGYLKDEYKRLCD